MKMPELKAKATTTFAVTGWGTFYIYNGMFGIIFYFLLIGAFVGIFENVLIKLIPKADFLTVAYVLFYCIFFESIVFEGVFVFFLKRHLLSFVFVYMLFYYFAELIFRKIEQSISKKISPFV